MKIALYIEDGIEQIILTPESDTEKALLGKMHDGSRTFGVFSGSFYECRGGYVRQDKGESSTIIVLRPNGKTKGDISDVLPKEAHNGQG